jgi:hypothetical protein
MRFKAAGLSNILGFRSPHLTPFHLRDGGRASGRLKGTRASSSSSACSGTFLYSPHTCWKRCYQNHITLSYACQAGQNWIPFMLSYHLGSLSMSGYVGFLDVVLDPSYQLWLKVSWRCILNVCVVLQGFLCRMITRSSVGWKGTGAELTEKGAGWRVLMLLVQIRLVGRSICPYLFILEFIGCSVLSIVHFTEFVGPSQVEH